LEQEFGAISASSLHELLHAHELMDRVTVARTLVAHMQHRKETRWHCYQERLDYPERDDARWSVFVNSVRRGDQIEMIERAVERATMEVVLPPLADGAIIRHGSE
jgi:adenylylsulfate reductase subunit A